MSVFRIPLGELPAGGARLQLAPVPYTAHSFVIQAFIDLDDDQIEAARPDHPNFVGLFSMYGLGQPPSESQQSMVYELEFEVSAALAAKTSAHSELVLVVRDFGQARIPAPGGWAVGPLTIVPKPSS